MYQTLVEKSSFSEDEVIFKRGCVGVCVLFAKIVKSGLSINSLPRTFSVLCCLFCLDLHTLCVQFKNCFILLRSKVVEYFTRRQVELEKRRASGGTLASKREEMQPCDREVVLRLAVSCLPSIP